MAYASAALIVNQSTHLLFCCLDLLLLSLLPVVLKQPRKQGGTGVGGGRGLKGLGRGQGLTGQGLWGVLCGCLCSCLAGPEQHRERGGQEGRKGEGVLRLVLQQIATAPTQKAVVKAYNS